MFNHKNVSEDTQEMPQSQSTTFLMHQKNENQILKIHMSMWRFKCVLETELNYKIEENNENVPI